MKLGKQAVKTIMLNYLSSNNQNQPYRNIPPDIPFIKKAPLPFI